MPRKKSRDGTPNGTLEAPSSLNHLEVLKKLRIVQILYSCT